MFFIANLIDLHEPLLLHIRDVDLVDIESLSWTHATLGAIIVRGTSIEPDTSLLI